MDKAFSKLLLPSCSMPSKMLVSSAERVTRDSAKLVRSLMYNKKRFLNFFIGPRTEPRGTPVRIFANSELKLLTWKYWYLSDFYALKSAYT